MRVLSLALILTACAGAPPDPSQNAAGTEGNAQASEQRKAEAQAFLEEVTREYVRLSTEVSEAEWAAQTRIVEGDDTLVTRQKQAWEAYSDYLGSEKVLAGARAHLASRADLSDLQIRQLEALLYEAAPRSVAHRDLVVARIEAEAAQTQTLYGYTFKLGDKEITPNDIDRMLASETDVALRQKVWESSKGVGPGLRPGLIKLRQLRNDTVRKAGYEDYYQYQVSEYGVTADEMDALLLRLMQELWPLYRELHTWTRYELAARYGQPVPDLLPAHWLPNRWGQSWASIVEVQGLDVDAALKDKPPSWITKEAESFYVSLGFMNLPGSFWDKSSLYPVAPDAGYKKNTHASAWHVDLNQDVRSLMSVESNSEWFQTANHELGHIYYYMSYTRPDVPPLLRKGANRAFHEAVGTQMGMAAMQQPFLVSRGLVPADAVVDQDRVLLKEALDAVVFMPFSVGTMTGFERDLYRRELPAERWNARWWQLAAHYQGMVPPTPRDETYADALTKTHINDDAAQYYDYALSYVILFQLHDHISKNILKQDPRATNYWGSRETGDFLRKVLEPGGTRDWRALLREATGEEISARAMLEYYAPLMTWLKAQNAGRTYTLPEKLEAPPPL